MDRSTQPSSLNVAVTEVESLDPISKQFTRPTTGSPASQRGTDLGSWGLPPVIFGDKGYAAKPSMKLWSA